MSSRRPQDVLRRALDKRRGNEADIRYRQYVQPAGRGLHVVRNIHTGQEIIVSSLAGSRTFKPGSEVTTGSHTGHQGEAIIGLPPAERQGASRSGFVFSPRRGFGEVPELPDLDAPEPDPTIDGAAYVALWLENNAAAPTLSAWVLDEDGAILQEVDGSPWDPVISSRGTGQGPFDTDLPIRPEVALRGGTAESLTGVAFIMRAGVNSDNYVTRVLNLGTGQLIEVTDTAGLPTLDEGGFPFTQVWDFIAVHDGADSYWLEVLALVNPGGLQPSGEKISVRKIFPDGSVEAVGIYDNFLADAGPINSEADIIMVAADKIGVFKQDGNADFGLLEIGYPSGAELGEVAQTNFSGEFGMVGPGGFFGSILRKNSLSGVDWISTAAWSAAITVRWAGTLRDGRWIGLANHNGDFDDNQSALGTPGTYPITGGDVVAGPTFDDGVSGPAGDCLIAIVGIA